MTIKIRNGIFETNSSSTHALVFNPYNSKTQKQLKSDVDLIFNEDFTRDWFEDEFFVYNPDNWNTESIPQWIRKFMYFYYRVCRNFKFHQDWEHGFFEDNVYCAKVMKDFFREISGVNANIICQVEVLSENIVSIEDGVLKCYYDNELLTFRLVPESKYENYSFTSKFFPNLYNEDKNSSDNVFSYSFLVYENDDLRPVADIPLYQSFEADLEIFEERDCTIPDWVYLQIIKEYILNDAMELHCYYHSLYDGDYYQFCEQARRIYTNGNFYTCIFGDGTRLIISEDDNLKPEFPMSVDLKITDKCNNSCLYCYENSSPDGDDADESIVELVKALPQYTEVTLGGGNPLESGMLEKIIWECNTSVSFTINQLDIDRLISADWFEELILHHGISGDFCFGKGFKADVTAIGISVSCVDNELIEKLRILDKEIHIVVHVTAGIIDLKELEKLYDNNFRLLILGYKVCGRGKDYYSENVEKRITDIKENIDEIQKHFRVTAFDNLALKQLDVKRLVSEDAWERLYQGEEGEFSMYIDGVKREFAVASYFEERYSIEEMSIKRMFKYLKQ